MNNVGTPRNRCPQCGGKIIVIELYQRSEDYIVKRDGRLPKRPNNRNKYTEFEGTIATCSNSDCKVHWDIGEFTFDSEGRFTDLKYMEEEDE